MATKGQIPIAGMIVFAIIAFIGFADSVYLTASHYMGEVPTCTVVEGCDEVAISEYSTIAEIPVALFGSAFYLLMIVLAFVWFDMRKTVVIKLLPLFTVPAFIFSGWLIYVMFYLIEAICIFCLISAGTTTMLMILSLVFYKKLMPGNTAASM